MKEIWRLLATLRSEALFTNGNYEILLNGLPEYEIEIHFSSPRKVEHVAQTYWDKGRPLYGVWNYDIIFRFKAKDAVEAQTKGWRQLEDIATRLSFLASASVIVESYGSITNAPESPKAGKQYVSIFNADEQAGQTAQQPLIKGIESLAEFLLGNTFGQEKEEQANRNERINRSMRWLQHSYMSQAPVDEFVCLMLSFEGISKLLEPAKPRYWHCGACDKDVLTCPHCGAGTEWEGSGNLAMKNFVCGKLGWKSSQWAKIWKLRNVVVHGSHDLTRNQQQTIRSTLPKIEEAVVSALTYLVKLPPQALPLTLRKRGEFYEPKLHIEWTHNEPNRSKEGEV